MEISHSPWPWLSSDATALAGYGNEHDDDDDDDDVCIYRCCAAVVTILAVRVSLLGEPGAVCLQYAA